MTTTNTYGRQVVVPLTNKSGGGVVAGDVVIVDTSNNDAFTTTTTGAFTGGIGIAQETIASNATGRVLLSGYAALVNVNASVTRGNFGKTHTVAKQATDAGSSRIAGTFCQFLTGGTTPDATVWQSDLGGGSGLTDPMTTRGDIIVRNSSNVSARLAVGATANMALKSDGTDPSWGILPGTLIGINAYGPSGSATVFNCASVSYVDVDATNMKVTFTAPASGNVIVRMSSWADCTATHEGYWGLRESTSNITPSMGNVLRAQTPGAMAFVTYTVYLTGVSGGSHTYKWAFAADNATSGTHRIVCGGGEAVTKFAPAIMEVYAA